MTIRITSFSLAIVVLAGCGPRSERVEPKAVSWTYDIRPILAAKCFRCHGADENHNESGLRLDLAESMVAPLNEGGGRAIVPGALAQSILWKRIHSSDPDEVMPPPAADLALDSRERALIGKWIEQGAKFEPHWAFQPLRPTVPVPEGSTAWPKNDIDRFIFAGLDRRQTRPARAADPLRWLRRVSFDLVGLPPTAQEVEDFLDAVRSAGDDDAPYEAVVDRLLASPAYGERMATAWLATMRHADTWNFAEDSLNTQWSYRDWVIRAFNENLPYHRLITQQLAGDHLDGPTPNELLATAFLRTIPLPVAGELRRGERLADLAAQRVALAGSSLLGLSLECARCHQHPIDPLSATDFHGLAAFFGSIPESGLADAPEVVPAPTLWMPDGDQDARLETGRARITALEDEVAALSDRHEATFRAWLDEEGQLPLIADAVGIFTFDEESTTITNHALGASAPGAAEGLRYVDGVHGKAAGFDGASAVTFSDLFPVTRWKAWTFALWMRATSDDPGPARLVSRANDMQGIDLRLEAGHLSARLFRDWPGNAIAVRTTRPVVRTREWTHVVWSYDGSSAAAGLRLYANGQPLETTVVADRFWKSAVPVHPTKLRLGGAGFAGGEIDDFQVYARALTPLEIAHLYDGRALTDALHNPEEHLEALREFYFSSLDPEARRMRSELATARQQLVESERPVLEVAVMEENPEMPAPDLVAFEDGNARPPSTPAFLPPLLSSGAVPNRLDLAAWLTSPDHPLTARVCVNRVWENFFGDAIVATTDDFGLRSPAPSHPDLLDWLARDFIESGWDVKRLCRQIALSATYRQDSHPPGGADASHGLLAGVAARPLSDLEVRDLALSASGLLDATRGGPPVAAGRSGSGPPRRALYSVWKRDAPRLLPVAANDSGSPHCSVERAPDSSSTPLLVRRNAELLVEASRALAQRTLQHGDSSDEDRLDSAFMALAGRSPEPDELAQLHLSLAAQRDHFRDEDGDAPQLIQPGNPGADPAINPQELAVWTAVCVEMFGLDAVRWKH